MSKVIKLKDIRNDFDSCLEELLNLCNQDINDVNNQIIEKIDSNVELVKKIANYIVLSGGKRIRPLLTIACTKMSDMGLK